MKALFERMLGRWFVSRSAHTQMIQRYEARLAVLDDTLVLVSDQMSDALYMTLQDAVREARKPPPDYQ